MTINLGQLGQQIQGKEWSKWNNDRLRKSADCGFQVQLVTPLKVGLKELNPILKCWKHNPLWSSEILNEWHSSVDSKSVVRRYLGAEGDSCILQRTAVTITEVSAVKASSYERDTRMERRCASSAGDCLWRRIYSFHILKDWKNNPSWTAESYIVSLELSRRQRIMTNNLGQLGQQRVKRIDCPPTKVCWWCFARSAWRLLKGWKLNYSWSVERWNSCKSSVGVKPPLHVINYVTAEAAEVCDHQPWTIWAKKPRKVRRIRFFLSVDVKKMEHIFH